MTVNRQQFPTIPVYGAGWRDLARRNRRQHLSWDLQLVNNATQTPMTVQLIAIDGVAVHLPQDTTTGSMVQMVGGRFKVVALQRRPRAST